MTIYFPQYNPVTRIINVLQGTGEDGDTAPAVATGFTGIGSYEHENRKKDEQGLSFTHTHYAHVRDLMIAAGRPDTEKFSIKFPDGYDPVEVGEDAPEPPEPPIPPVEGEEGEP